VLLCDIVLAGSGVALLATGCQSQRGGASPSAPPLNTPLETETESKQKNTHGVIGVAVSGPEEATSGLAKLLVERQLLPV